MNYLLDTCTLIDISRGENKAVAERFLNVSKNNKIVIPQYVMYEFLCGLKVKNAKLQYIEFIELYKRTAKFNISDFTIAEASADIYAYCRKKGLPTASIDILIAAYSLLSDSILVTSNEKHFSGISGLKIENWRNYEYEKE
jgi:predicted nucleic acid-binding protein